MLVGAIARFYLVLSTPVNRYSFSPTVAEARWNLGIAVVWLVVGLLFALNLLAGKNWARIALGIWTLPLGVFLFLWPSVKAFTSGGEDAVGLQLKR